MKLSIEWEHADETEGSLEEWTADHNGVRLTVVRIPTADEPAEGHTIYPFMWLNNLTRDAFRTGLTDTVESAMLNAMDTLTERSTDE